LFHELGDGAVLLAAGFDDGQHGFYVAVAALAVCAEAQLSPDHAVT